MPVDSAPLFPSRQPQSSEKQNGVQYDADGLMYGTIPCAFRVVPGKTYSYESKSFTEVENTDAAREAALKKYSTLDTKEYGEEYKGIQCPALPTTELKIDRAASKDTSTWPQALKQPLIKVPLSEKHDFVGFACGVRSAIVRVDGKWYRLKGCGNNDIGFPLRVNSTNREFRGCMFPETAARELYMSKAVCDVLGPLGFLGANEPLGWYEYDPFEQKTVLRKMGSPPKWTPATSKPYTLPRVLRCCGLFKINGDRRLDCHVLNGLELLLPRVCAGADMKSVLGAFPTARNDVAKGTPQQTGEVVAYSFEIMWHMSMFGKFPTPGAGDSSTLYNALVDPSKLNVKESAPAFPSRSIVPGGDGKEELWISYQRQQPTNVELAHTKNPVVAGDKMYPRLPDAKWKPLWDKCEEELKKYYAAGGKPLLPYLYWRFGFECGTILRAFTNAGLSWGTYDDPLGSHCNAHANNLVLLAENAEGHNQTFLAPLDLDMSFTKDNFIFSYYKMAGRGAKIEKLEKKDESTWAQSLKQEATGFLKTIAGDMGGSTGVTNVAPMPRTMLPLKVALRDVVSRAFWSAYNKEKDVCPPDPKMRKPAYALLKQALIMTSQNLA